MSTLEVVEPQCQERQDAEGFVIDSESHDLGGFSVRRVLPAPLVKRVGPFVFFDEMGPADFPPGQGISVRPHPHIGLSTVTFLFDGEIMHRDSLGYTQPIQPGAVNLMTAGRGIVHSERTSPERMENGQRLHGIQVWMALPEDQQEIDPDFRHYPKNELPVMESDGVTTTVIIGTYADVTSPVAVLPETLYLFQHCKAGSTAALKGLAPQVGLYVVSGKVTSAGTVVEPGSMLVPGVDGCHYEALEDSRVMVIGGEDVGERRKFWNFIHTSRERINEAKQRWKDGGFDMVEGDDEFIPLPEAKA